MKLWIPTCVIYMEAFFFIIVVGIVLKACLRVRTGGRCVICSTI